MAAPKWESKRRQMSYGFAPRLQQSNTFGLLARKAGRGPAFLAGFMA
jgi:hypothetical protein